MLHLPRSAWEAMVAHALDGFPDEACGLLAGTDDPARATDDPARATDDPARATDATAAEFVPCVNVDASSRTFSLGADAWAAVDELDGRGLQVLAVVHSHTHTEAYPSPTDVAQAANPFIAGWRWVLVSLKHPEPSVRSYRIDGEVVAEEPVRLVDR